MKTKYISILAFGVLLTGLLIFSSSFYDQKEVGENENEHIGAEALWASSSKTPFDLAKEVDLIVQVRAVSINPTRLIVNEFPVSAKPSDDLSEKVVPSGEVERHVLPFTDTNFEIAKVYSGDKTPGDIITIVQTGGMRPSANDQSRQLFEISGDPLYKVGEEYILFLKDASGDQVHSPDRELFIVMTPHARYRLKSDGSVFNYGTLDHAHDQNEALEEIASLKLADLENQIQMALSGR